MCECKTCGEQKVRVKAGANPNGSSRFVDGEGRYWNGRTCPQCRLADGRARWHASKRPRTAVEEDESEFGPKDVLYPPKLRPCRTCKKPNPNYYRCNDCMSLAAQHGCYDSDMWLVEAGVQSRTLKAGWHY